VDLVLWLKFLYQTAFDYVEVCQYFLSRLGGRNGDVVENQNFCKTKHF